MAAARPATGAALATPAEVAVLLVELADDEVPELLEPELEPALEESLMLLLWVVVLTMTASGESRTMLVQSPVRSP